MYPLFGEEKRIPVGEVWVAREGACARASLETMRRPISEDKGPSVRLDERPILRRRTCARMGGSCFRNSFAFMRVS